MQQGFQKQHAIDDMPAFRCFRAHSTITAIGSGIYNRYESNAKKSARSLSKARKAAEARNLASRDSDCGRLHMTSYFRTSSVARCAGTETD